MQSSAVSRAGLLAAVAVLCMARAVSAQVATPSSKVAIFIAPSEWELNPDRHYPAEIAAFYEALPQAGYDVSSLFQEFAPTFGTGQVSVPDVNVQSIASALRGGSGNRPGWIYFSGHGMPAVSGNAASLLLEAYPNSISGREMRDQRLTELRSVTYNSAQLVSVATVAGNGNWTNDGIGIGATPSFFQAEFVSRNTVIDLSACFGAQMAGGFPGALAVVGYPSSVHSATAANQSRLQYVFRLAGHTGAQFSTLGASLGADPVRKVVAPGGNASAVIAPRVVSVKSNGVDLTPFEAILSTRRVTVEFNADMKTTVPAQNIVRGFLGIRTANPSWDAPRRLSFDVSGTYNGNGLIVLHVDSVNVGAGAESAGGIPLDGNFLDWGSYPTRPPDGSPPPDIPFNSNSTLPGKDPYLFPLSSEMGGDNPDSRILGFRVQREIGGLVAKWHATHSVDAAQYWVEGEAIGSSTFEVLGVTAATGPGFYSLALGGGERPGYRLRERTVVGDTLTYDHAAVQDSSGASMESGGYTDPQADEVRADLAASYPYSPNSTGQPRYLIVTPTTWLADAQNLAGFWNSRGVATEVRTLTQSGGPHGIRAMLSEYAGSLRAVLLFADANDAYDVGGVGAWLNDEWWASWYPRPAWPTQPALNIIPMYRYSRVLGPSESSMTSTTPYYGSDWGYIDFDSDGLPDPGLSIGRAPVNSQAEATAFVSKTIAAVQKYDAAGTGVRRYGLWTYGKDYARQSGAYALEVADSIAAYAPAGSVLASITVNSTTGADPRIWQVPARNALNDGLGVLSIVSTNSTRQSWGTFLNITQGFNVENLVANPPAYPFVLGPTCQLNNFDQTEACATCTPEPGSVTESGAPLIERMLLHPTKGVAGAFAPTRGSWQRGDWLVAREFLRASRIWGAGSAAAAAARAVRTVAQRYPEFVPLAEQFVFLGDPMLTPWGSSAPVTDCNGNGIPDAQDLTAHTSTDADCDGIPDECQASRLVQPASTAVLTSPGGNRDHLRWSAWLDGICTDGVREGTPRVYAVCVQPRSDDVWVWPSVGPTDPRGDTLWATSYDHPQRLATWDVAQVSGCGILKLDVFVDGLRIGRLVDVNVRSTDVSPVVHGATDAKDASALASAVLTGTGGPCFDLDRSGTITGADVALVAADVGRSRSRFLLQPVGGESFEWGEFADVRWRPGRGDSSRVTISVVRDGSVLEETVLASDLADDGSHMLPLYVTDAPRSDYRLIVRHSAGAPNGSNWVGSATGGAPFSIAEPSGGGCPTVSTLVGGRWAEENSILGRSLSGAMALDACRLNWLMPDSGGAVTLSIQETEHETTELDRDRLVAIDHPPGLQAFALGDSVLVGRRELSSAAMSSTRGDVAMLLALDVGYEVAPAETLTFTGPRQPFAALGSESTTDGSGGFVIDDGEKGEGGGFQAMLARGVEPSNIDAEILSSEGYSVEGLVGDQWVPISRRYPRQQWSDAVFLPGAASRVRIIGHGRHRVRRAGSVIATDVEFIATKLTPAVAQHNRLGNVLAALVQEGTLTTTLQPGDSLLLTFVDPPLRTGFVREYFLLSKGAYSSSLPARPISSAADRRPWVRLLGAMPVRSEALLAFGVPTSSDVRIDLYDVLGRRTRKVVDAQYEPGTYTTSLIDGSGPTTRIAPGVYWYRASIGEVHFRGRVVVVP